MGIIRLPRWNVGKIGFSGTRWQTSLDEDVVPFSPSGTPALWYDLSVLEGYEDDEKIEVVPDLMGNFNLADSSAVNPGPVFKTDIQNGLSVSRMFGLGYFKAAGFESSVQPLTIFIVFKYIDPIGSPWWVADNSNGPYINTSSGFHAINGDNQLTTNIPHNTTNFVLATLIFNGANSEMRINGVSGATGDAGTGVFINELHIGASHSGANRFNGDLGEFIFYNGLESVAANESGLMSKWGI
jgi:hypothetical protein